VTSHQFYVVVPIPKFLVFSRRGHGHAVAQLVEALRYKPEGRGFYSQ
jgi:hypothetical protein